LVTLGMDDSVGGKSGCVGAARGVSVACDVPSKRLMSPSRCDQCAINSNACRMRRNDFFSNASKPLAQ
jgi:hypothetical protein